MNISILGTSELKWTGMGEFNSADHSIPYCGQEEMNSPQSQQKSLKCSIWVQFQNDKMISSVKANHSKITVIQVYAPTTNTKEAEVDRF